MESIINVEDEIKQFIKKIEDKEIEIYNEPSLQFELGHFFKNRYPKIKVQVEKNIESFGLNKKNFVKHRIDLVLDSNNNIVVFELKYPLKSSGQVPERMFEICRDLKFLEQLKSDKIQTYQLLLTNNNLFWEGNSNDGIYTYFRNGDNANPGVSISGMITKPTGSEDEIIELQKVYEDKWIKIEPDHRLYFI